MFDQPYLQRLIDDRTEENLNLDYKAAAALARDDKKVLELSKDVSAFANSDGGIIVYGLKEDVSNRHLASGIDPLDRVAISKEWLEQIINGKIRPKVPDVKIHPVEIDGDKQKVVYIIEIPKSSTAHQAEDKRYYKRYNFMSEPMYDYELRDVLNRAKQPIITIDFEVNTYYEDNDEIYYLKVYATNEGVVLAKYIYCHITFPRRCYYDEYKSSNQDLAERYGDNTVRDILDIKYIMPGQSPSYNYGPSRYDPLLPRLRTKLNFSDIELNKHYTADGIQWTVYADNSEPNTGSTAFRDIPINHE